MARTLALIAQLRQHIDEHVPNRFVVIHDQHHALPYHRGTWPVWRRHKRVRGGRQIEGDGGPDPDVRGDRDAYVVLGDNGISNRKAEPTATGFRGEIGIKDFGELVRRDAAALIAQGDLDPAPLGEQRRETSVAGEVFRPDRDDPSLGHRLLGIEDDIIEDLMDLAGINLDRPEIRWEG